MMEMVNDHAMVFPIMATAFIALGASKLLCRKPVYWSLADDFLGNSGPDAPVKSEDTATKTGQFVSKSTAEG